MDKSDDPSYPAEAIAAVEAAAAARAAAKQAKEDAKKPKVNRQTVSYLSRRFAEVGLNPNKRHGQNFLVDLNLIQMLSLIHI